MNLRIILLILLCLGHSAVFAQDIQVELFGRIAGLQEGEELGTWLEHDDVNEDGITDLFIGAPGARVGNNNQAGRIYLMMPPLSGDTVLSERNVIIEGTSPNERIGSQFLLGDFDNDGINDIVIGNAGANSDSGRVDIFFGPFEEGVKRRSNAPDIIINGRQFENFGVALSVVFREGTGDGLLVGASAWNNFTGRAYYFESVDETIESTKNATASFFGKNVFDLYGENVLSIGDINNDAAYDLMVLSPKNSENKILGGAAFIYLGPFTEQEYQQEDADLIIYGRAESTLWGNRAFAHGDVNGDGMDDFSIASDGDETGKLAYFQGRETWSDTIYVGTNVNENERHVLFQSSFEGFGFSADFSGDFNIDGIKDPIIGAPYTSTDRGALSIHRQNGQVVRPIQPSSALGALTATHIMAVPEIAPDSLDPYNIDDIIIGSPFNSTFASIENRKSGVVFLYSGKLNPPRVVNSVNPASVNQIGDSTTVTFTIQKGSRDITTKKMFIRRFNYDNTFSEDSIDYSATEDLVFPIKFESATGSEIQIDMVATDDFGTSDQSSRIIYFSAIPDSFRLQSSFDTDTLRIRGDGLQTLSFDSEASADTNGLSIRYELLFALSEEDFIQGRNLSLQSTSSSPEFNLTYNTINSYLINNGFVNLGVPDEIYWSVRARNFRGNAPQLFRMASNGPRKLPFIRGGLDPYFNMTKSPSEWTVEGFDYFVEEISWSGLITENPNATFEYEFVILENDNLSEVATNALYTSPRQSTTTFELSFGTIDSLLRANNVLEQAKSEGVVWYYTVKGIIDGQEDNVWFPTQRTIETTITHVILISDTESDEEISDLPQQFEIYPNFPNPFNPTTQLKFALPEPLGVRISIYNLLGQLVYSWQSSGSMNTGFHTHQINAFSWSSGIYIYQIQAGRERLTGKMSLIK